ncbi:MAG: minichromosome maintenance protein MCM [Candidatus Aenigmatarchaeota archaeon]|nr:MAG: minichromosome maintenance protein MCM [Candidatus Aenigmarchaeota archaeon]
MIEKLEQFIREMCYQKLLNAASEGLNHVYVDYADLDRFDPVLSDVLLHAPERFFIDLAEAQKGIDLGTDKPKRITFRFEGVPDDVRIRIKDLRSEHIGKFVRLEGTIKRASEVMPEVQNAIFECPDCGERHEVLQVAQTLSYPNGCSCGRKKGFKFIDRTLHDARYIVMEDNLEMILGERPGTIKIFLKDDLTTPKVQRKTDPGARLEITGIVRELPKKIDGVRSRQLEMFLEANSIKAVEQDFEEVIITPEDERAIREFAARPDACATLVRSLAPSMYGLNEVKEAIILQLFGGVPQVLPDGMRIRGDLHILLVGDPSVGKTQLLQHVAEFMPRGRYVSGKGTSAAGLTATVVKDDEFVGGWVLEAGAVVLSNKSVLCIDEFDKMSREDQINLHEAMSAQTVSISKATIQTTLPARTAILAGCNPKFSRFDEGRSIAEQIEIPDTLLSRFDVKFVLKDKPDKENDERLVEHVIRSRLGGDAVKPEVDTVFFKKYIALARKTASPQMTRKAAAMFKNFFVELRARQAGEHRAVPITLRQYEALMRLSEASARLRLAEEVNDEDAERAIRLMKESIRQLGSDTETGELDIDKAEGGTSASQRNRIRTVVETIEELEKSLGKVIPEQEIMAALEDKGIDETAANTILNEMKHKGMLFAPRMGHLQKV